MFHNIINHIREENWVELNKNSLLMLDWNPEKRWNFFYFWTLMNANCDQGLEKGSNWHSRNSGTCLSIGNWAYCFKSVRCVFRVLSHGIEAHALTDVNFTQNTSNIISRTEKEAKWKHSPWNLGLIMRNCQFQVSKLIFLGKVKGMIGACRRRHS